VTARKNKNITAVKGKGESTILEGVEPPKKDFWEISVTRLAETTTVDKVKTCLQSHGIELKDVFVFSSKTKGCKSAKVRVALEHKIKAKDENVWPLHCRSGLAQWVAYL
jgi:hypothetical protein